MSPRQFPTKDERKDVNDYLFRDPVTRAWGFTIGNYTVQDFSKRHDARIALELVMEAM